MSSPVLAFPEQDGNYILYTDARDVGVGAVLAQKDVEGKRKLFLMHRKHSRVQRRTGLPQKEAYAVVWALQYLHPYVFKQVVVYTDHARCTCAMDFKTGRA